MAYKMRSGNKPQFKNMGSSPVKSHNAFHKDPVKINETWLKTNQNNQLSNVNISGGDKTKQKKRNIIQPQLIPSAPDPVLEKADYAPIERLNKNKKDKKSRAQFNNDVSSFINGVIGIPEDIVEDITGKVSGVGSWAKKGIDKRKAKRLERKQNKIDNTKPKKVKKDKKEVKKKNNKNTTLPNLSGTTSEEVDLTNKNLGPRNTTKNKSKNASSKKVEYAKQTLKVDDEKVEKRKKERNKKKNLKRISNIGGLVGEQLITQGIGAGIQALLTPREKKQRERGNPNLSGFSQLKFGRRKIKE